MRQGLLVGMTLMTLLVGAGCAHERVTYRNGCWVKLSESRWGDTKENVTACEPKRVKGSDDPIAQSVETCLYQAQSAWYNSSLQKSRQSGEPPSLDAWRQAASQCLKTSERLAQNRIGRLEAELEAARGRGGHLERENQELRNTLISCVEKQPNAFAEANATTESNSDSGARHESRMARGDDGDGEPRSMRRTSGARRAERAGHEGTDGAATTPASTPANGGKCPDPTPPPVSTPSVVSPAGTKSTTAPTTPTPSPITKPATSH